MAKIYKTRCWYCGTILTPKNWTRDHVVPRILGGWHTVEACADCNTLKADLMLEEFRVVFYGAHIKPFYGELPQRANLY